LNGSYGSLDYGSNVSNAVQNILRAPPDAVIITGDMVAGQKAGLNYQGMWNAFHRNVTEPLHSKGIPVFVTPGNHDASAYSGFEGERRIYQQTWSNHRPDSKYFLDDSQYPFNYAVRIGDTLLISLDVTRSFAGHKIPEPQLQWLTQTLEKYRKAPTKILFSHFPVFPVSQDREEDFIGDSRLTDLMIKYSVSQYLSGHHHAYFPGVWHDIHLTAVGCIGSGQRLLIGESTRSAASFLRFAVQGQEVSSIRAHLGSNPNHTVDHSSLPSAIHYRNFTIQRLQ
jgi:3',5'-cyclic AMP phosphodiesterase CpdA